MAEKTIMPKQGLQITEEKPQAMSAAEAKPGVQKDEYDVAVIGGGPGGYVCAIRCAQLGKKTVLVEKRELGGTCLNRGCIPAKALLHTSELYDELRQHGEALGIQVQDISVDFASAAKRKDEIVGRLRNGIAGLIRNRKIALIREEAFLTGKNSFMAGGKEYRAEKIVLATGSEPASIPVPGADRPGVVNSDAVLDMRTLPESCVIIGGGVIGIEFATLLSAFQKKATVIEMLPRILNDMDEDISNTMTKLLQKKGVEIHTNATLMEIQDGLTCVYEKDGKRETTAGQIVIIAVGRRPVTQTLNLHAAGVVSERNFISVNEKMQTNVPGIYAIGDVTGKMQLAHVASAQGLVAAANACGGEQKMRYNAVPACVYSNPEIASAGMTEAQVKAAGLPYVTGKFATAANGRSMIMNCQEGFAKIISHAQTGEILGAHVVAPRATDMISEICVAMNAEATIEELAGTIHPHPTVGEMIMEAAHDVEGLCCHKFY